MWATFAEMADPHALIVDQETIGYCSIDRDNQLHAFHVSAGYDEIATEVITHVLDTRNITAAMASTVDPAFLFLSLTAGGRAEPVVLMYEQVAEPATAESAEVRLAGQDDHAGAVVFYHAETGSPRPFLEGFLAERIDRDELYLVDADGQIMASGECRVDTRAVGHAHLGLVVGTGLRGRGMGRKLIRSLVELAKGRNLSPLCSTEPANLAAQRVIHLARFRSRHRVFRVETAVSP